MQKKTYKDLRSLRIETGYLSSFVAKKLKISLRHFNRIEAGEGYLTHDRSCELAVLYSVNIKDIQEIFERSKKDVSIRTKKKITKRTRKKPHFTK